MRTSRAIHRAYGNTSHYVSQQLGIESPRTSFARLMVNGTYVGLYSVVESPDKVFLASRFGENDGNLFQFKVLADPYDLGLRESYVPVPFEPKTHESEPDTSALTALMTAISEAPSEGYAESIARWIDPMHVLTYYAAEIATVQTDGLTGWFGANNFYLYQATADRPFVLIPWDRDFSFAFLEHPVFSRSETNVLLRRLLEDTTLRDAYLSKLTAAVRDHVTPASLTPRLEAAYELIRASVLEDPNQPSTELGDDQLFEDEVNAVRASIAARVADVERQLL